MRRALDYEHNRSAKYLFYIGYIMGFAYMLFIAVLLSLKVNNMRDTNAAGLIVGILPIILLADLFIRGIFRIPVCITAFGRKHSGNFLKILSRITTHF